MMKTCIKRCTLAIIMCGTVVTGVAQTEILNENFNSILFNYNISITGWTFSYCCGINNATNNAGSNNRALRIETSGSYTGNFGSATTPKCNYTGDAILTFCHAYTGNDKSKVTVSIEGEGCFEGYQSSKTYEVTVKNNSSNNSFSKETLRILGFTKNTTITFTLADAKNYIAIDDVKIVSTDGITLLEDSDNTETLTAYNGYKAHVTIRQLTGGIWNTMCLPFDVDMATMETALGENQDIQLRTYSSYDATNNVMNFTPVTGTGVISAGTPFLIKLNTTVKSPVFKWVTVTNTSAKTITNNNVSFVGTYNPAVLNTDGTHLFLTKSNTLAIPASDKNTINGMRAYISVPESMKFTATQSRIAFIDAPLPTAVSSPVQLTEPEAQSAAYTLSGQRLNHLKKGLNIVNGKLTFIK